MDYSLLLVLWNLVANCVCSMGWSWLVQKKFHNSEKWLWRLRLVSNEKKHAPKHSLRRFILKPMLFFCLFHILCLCLCLFPINTCTLIYQYIPTCMLFSFLSFSVSPSAHLHAYLNINAYFSFVYKVFEKELKNSCKYFYF